ncbi:MAG: biotin-dependent carboxyltransferase family protein [Variovorax sp.]|nr:biotin-dependent carboxyltransferase family protein [Variovorax sp.]
MAAALTVVRPGMLASVQDLGRHGHRQLGICPGGALDTLALVLANRLVGNADGAAGLEFTMGGGELRFDAPTRVAWTGDDFDARLDGRPVWPGWSLPVRAGQVLRFGRANRAPGKQGVRTWLAVAGGIDVPEILGSRSTDLKAGFGGFEGRALKAGDRLVCGEPALGAELVASPAFGAHLPWWPVDSGDGAVALRAMPGPELDLFTAASRELLWSAPWRITPQSNRMGSRLEGPELKRKRQGDILSSGVIPGTVQVPPSGQPIILMGDAQTTGGYPRIAVVIRTDLWKLAQAPLDARLRLRPVDAAEALAAWDARRRYLAHLAQGLAARGWPAPAQNDMHGTSQAD